MNFSNYFLHLFLLMALYEAILCASNKEKEKSSGKVQYHENKRAEHQAFFKSVFSHLGTQKQKAEGTSDLVPVANYFNKKVLKHTKAINDIHAGEKVEGEKTVEHFTKKRKLDSGQVSHSQND